MQILPITAVLAFACFPALADEGQSFTDGNGARYTILSERQITPALKAQMVEIINGDSALLMEMGVDCAKEQYAYLGMMFDLPVVASRDAEVAKVIGYSNSIITDKIGRITLTNLDANLENDSVVALFDMGCGRR